MGYTLTDFMRLHRQVNIDNLTLPPNFLPEGKKNTSNLIEKIEQRHTMKGWPNDNLNSAQNGLKNWNRRIGNAALEARAHVIKQCGCMEKAMRLKRFATLPAAVVSSKEGDQTGSEMGKKSGRERASERKLGLKTKP